MSAEDILEREVERLTEDNEILKLVIESQKSHIESLQKFIDWLKNELEKRR